MGIEITLKNAGVSMAIHQTEVVSADLDLQLDPLSLTLPVSTGILVVREKWFEGSSFGIPRSGFLSRNVQVQIIQDNVDIAVMYIKNFKNLGDGTVKIMLQDLIGVLDGIIVPAEKLECWSVLEGAEICDVCSTLNDILSSYPDDTLNSLEFSYEQGYNDYRLTGFLPYNISLREAVQYIAAGMGACVETDSNGVHFKYLTTGNPEIRDFSTLYSLKEEQDKTIDWITVERPRYGTDTSIENWETIYVAYESQAGSDGEEIIIGFDRPVAYVENTNLENGSVLELGYAKFVADANSKLAVAPLINKNKDISVGSERVTFEDAKKKKAKVTVQLKAHLTTKKGAIVPNYLERLYSHLSNNTVYKVKYADTIVAENGELRHEGTPHLGESVLFEDTYKGKKKRVVGRVVGWKTKLARGRIVSEVELRYCEPLDDAYFDTDFLEEADYEILN